MDDHLPKLLNKCIEECGSALVESRLHALLEEHSGNVLTIVSNKGLHPLRSAHTRGETFIASEGFLDYSSQEAATEAIEAVLERLGVKLKSKPWAKIYLVPFGPSVLAMHIKLFVYRVLHQETIDVLHAGDEKYYDIDIKQRAILVDRLMNTGQESAG
jgi:hypothetical protein